MLDRVALCSATTGTSSSQARARPLPSWGCWSSPYRSSTRMTRTPQPGSCELCWPGARLLPWSTFHGLDRGLDRGLGRLRAISLAMAIVGLLATRRLIPRAKRAGNFSRSSGTRTLNIAFASISAGGYSAQLGLAAALLANTQTTALQRALVLVIVGLYCSALGRAWVVTGITRRAPGSPAKAEPDAEPAAPLAAQS